MKISCLILTLFLVASFFFGCADDLWNSTDFGSVPTGAFRYLGFAENDSLIVKGWLIFDSLDPNGFDGTWHLEAVGNPQNIGPQTGDGRLHGRVENDQVVVDLNPEFRDNNVTLNGTLRGKTFGGEWTRSGFAGPMNHGRFEARQN